jgi:hypothetical protein
LVVVVVVEVVVVGLGVVMGILTGVVEDFVKDKSLVTRIGKSHPHITYSLVRIVGWVQKLKINYYT